MFSQKAKHSSSNFKSDTTNNNMKADIKEVKNRIQKSLITKDLADEV